MLNLEGITRYFGPVVAVDNVSLSVGKGDILGFLGPPGAIRGVDGKERSRAVNKAIERAVLADVRRQRIDELLKGREDIVNPLDEWPYRVADWKANILKRRIGDLVAPLSSSETVPDG